MCFPATYTSASGSEDLVITPSPTGDRDRETHIQGIEKTLKENEKRINELKKGLEELSNIPLGTWIKDVRAKAKQLLNKTLSWDKK